MMNILQIKYEIGKDKIGFLSGLDIAMNTGLLTGKKEDNYLMVNTELTQAFDNTHALYVPLVFILNVRQLGYNCVQILL